MNVLKIPDKEIWTRPTIYSKVKATWSGCLFNEENLPDNWHRLPGVLVGMGSVRSGALATGSMASWETGHAVYVMTKSNTIYAFVEVHKCIYPGVDYKRRR